MSGSAARVSKAERGQPGALDRQQRTCWASLHVRASRKSRGVPL